MAKGGKPKKPAVAVEPDAGKAVRGGSAADSVTVANFKWATDQIDLGGPYGWQAVTVDRILQEIIPKLHDYEGQTWAHVDGPSGSHFVEVHDCCKPARKRLVEIGRNDTDQLFSLRITGKCRIWGIRDRAILRVLWWDPEHEICPSKLKHT